MSPAALVLLAAVAIVPAEQDREKEASELLAKAEKGVEAGQFIKAVNTYKRLEKEYADTDAGRRAARRTGKNAYLGAADLVRNGPSKNRVDVAVMGDGFELEQQGDFNTLAKVAPRNFERYAVLEEYYGYHNFIRVNVRSAESGVDGHGREYETALGAYRSGAIQGQVAVRTDRVRAVLNELPEHDDIAIAFVKNGDLGTGGDGIASVGGRSPETMIHEWGHAFASLMDEYSANTGHRGQVNTGPNVSRTDDPKQVPWRHWLEKRVSGVGIYQGADGRPQGAWKPTTNCIMDVGVDFCEVCREALILEIYRFVDPIEESAPPPHRSADDAIEIDKTQSVRKLMPVEFRVRVMEPANHSIEVSFWVLPEDAAPTWTDPDVDRALKDRRQRGALAPIEAKPAQRRSVAKGGLHVFQVDPRDYEPGRYRVICRAVDDTKVRGEKRPWVLKDEAGLLESERSWWLFLMQ